MCVPQALFDLEATNQDFKTDLRDLYITSAQLIDVTASKNAIIIHVPYRLLKGFQKIQQRLVRELEKKFSGKDVVLVANRRIMPRTKNGSSKARPRSRTLTNVSNSRMQDYKCTDTVYFGKKYPPVSSNLACGFGS